MDPSLTTFVLTAVTLATALNLALTLRLAAKLRPQAPSGPLTVPIGRRMPDFEGRAAADGRALDPQSLAGRASVLVFLSAGCPKCRGTIPDLLEILPAMERADVALWIVPMEGPDSVSRLLGGGPLAERILTLEPAARHRLNPRNAAPFYLFVDEALIVQASHFVGDDDWLSFLAQMREAPPAAAAAR